MISRLQSLLRKKDIDAAIFVNMKEGSRNMTYLSGYSGNGCLCVPKTRKPFLIVPEMEKERASGKVRTIVWKKKLFEQLAQHLGKTKKIGIEFLSLSYLHAKALKKHIKGRLVDISEDMLNLRAIKTDKEIRITKKSCSIATKIIEKAISKIRSFDSEQDVARYLMLETFKKDCTLAFPSIVGSGKNASMPHYEPKETKLKKGFCVIDFGVVHKGYHSDITRTIYLGKPEQKEKNWYELVLKAHNEARNLVKQGLKCKKTYEKVNQVFGKHQKYFTHGLGHGIGRQIHEFPNLTPKSDHVFQNGMIFTIEPGLYIPGKWGIRIEDDYLLRNNKLEQLTPVSKKLTTR